MFKNVTIFFAVGVLLTGCVQPPPPFTGPIAHIQMYQTPHAPFGQDYFYVAKIDGKDYAGNASPVQYQGSPPSDFVNGQALIDVPAGRPVVFTLVGHTIYPMPILAMTMPVHDLQGTTSFTPLAGATYFIKGKFTPTYSGIWIEDSHGGLAAPKVDVNDYATVNAVDKMVRCGPMGCSN